ncbi:MAG: hypothetical protein KDA92_22155, partial [Planctomycetales bacterium]|nr:hypothetical protein [Planctomycetales bacterium]
MNAPRVSIFLTLLLLPLPLLSAQGADDSSAAAVMPQAVVAANREFTTPEMSAPELDEAAFSFTDVGAKIPNYTPGERWGTQGEPLTKMQNPLPAEASLKAYSTPSGLKLSIWAKEGDSNWPTGSQPSSAAAGLSGKPIAMNWDERGRLWVCETVDYPNELSTGDGLG